MARLEVLRAVGAELAKPGEVRDRFSHALTHVVGAAGRFAVLEYEEGNGRRTTLTAGIDFGRAHGAERIQASLQSKQRKLGTLTLHGASFDAGDRVLIELLSQQLAMHVSSEYFASSDRNELEMLLLAVVGHDLRNPLGVVSIAAAMLLAGDLNEAQRLAVKRVVAANQQSQRLVSDLLDFALARRTGIELVRDRCDLHGVVERAIEDVRVMWPGRELVHERQGDGVACLDEGRILQIAMNLIGNALQHSPTATTVRVQTRGEASAVELSVLNEGRPIAPALMSQLFTPLRRGDEAGHRHGSLGLGLFIVRHLVVGHAGTIHVSSTEREGTRFTVRLPRAPQSSAP